MLRYPRRYLVASALSAGGVILALTGCGSGGSSSGSSKPKENPWQEAKSDKQRATAPEVEPVDLQKLTADNGAFALALYQAVRKTEGNLFYSPYSISLALAMTYAGARGDTESQMAAALHFGLAQDKLHPAFNALDLSLPRDSATKAETKDGQETTGFRLRIANALWGQNDHQFLPAFLDTLAENYGAGLQLLDFKADPEAARSLLNQWVNDQTEEKIKDLFPEGSVTDLTRLVLANAIYFNAAWLHPFTAEQTRDGDFHLLDGSKGTAPMMAETEMFGYAAAEGYQAVELPYDGGDFSMLILLPAEGQFATFEESLDAGRVGSVVSGLRTANVRLTLPKFTYSMRLGLKQTLAAMGMKDAFEPGAADLSGMDGSPDLFIMDVLHKAYVNVNEAGTEAAAATGVVVGTTSAPPPPVEMKIDRPFLFVIRHQETGTLLFVGRVVNPTA
ncbi:serpin family protein [bacterium]|nr:serpin family protein [bacterium]PIU95210.1 MAG: serpin family protein [Armatimonadetes bacterium CG06_land_8_20_14_3_00_66_21]PIX44149.1 MAG: serpin family protein [Armatimonadetes bacterium CG_4_8_14_3_um_filter_66_20]PIY54379.1 MAG: serpin family protein [Armatimonadetes bacterium CG_4_10_14_3_um_filter_66_18]PIZ49294.1 MAG: serpin family protein [Armatimonadetes bacterium CG_4_10_14_0_8_um_filter_66_14]PJB73728.1 MAG: serpin family protein [Armatimonadetes bacterium CG_4_9_14_3_um_filte